MAFTYDQSQPTSRDRVRMGLADPSVGGGIFSDAEIDAFLTHGGGDVNAAIRIGLRALMVHHANRGDSGRVAALRLVLDAYGGDDMPLASVTMGADLPFDRGYVERS